MFERYTEPARRTIFFARYEASQFGSPQIEAEHLLLGLLRQDKALVNRLLPTDAGVEELRNSIARRGNTGLKIATSTDLPLSYETKRALVYGAEESERLQQRHIGTEHLLLGLLREEKCFAAQLLRAEGVTVESAREHVRQSVSIAGFDRWIVQREADSRWTIERRGGANITTHFALYAVGEPKEEAPAPRVPVVCIAIVGGDVFSGLRQRCEGYVAEGVPEVWLLDLGLKRAYIVTKGDGLREFKGESLQIADPPLEMDLGKIFD
jgi:hypothetical protein